MAENYAIKVAAKIICQFFLIQIYIDNLAATKTLIFNIIKSKYFYDCLKSLKLQNSYQVELIRVSEHYDIEGNEQVYECEKPWGFSHS